MSSLSFAVFFLLGCAWLLTSFAHFERSRKNGRLWNLAFAFFWMVIAAWYWYIGTANISGW